MHHQERTPIYESLLKVKEKRIVSFDVPGHKQGKSSKVQGLAFGEKLISMDYNTCKFLDSLIHPSGAIKEAEELAAEAFGAHAAFFMCNGTTQAVQAMIWSSIKPGEKIIMPRNVHKSAINALILCGGIPVYVNPGVDYELGISLGMDIANVEKAIKNNPDAKAVFVNNPTYYGICSDLKGIVELAHSHNMLVLADEAHGTHLYFGKDLPINAMKAGADMASVSTHKTGGSLTQSSLLLVNKSLDPSLIRQTINITQTTSASYILMSSLDIARKELYFEGEKTFQRVLNMVEYARNEINEIGGYYAFSKEKCNGKDFFDFDRTKLSVHTQKIGLAGIEIYDILHDEYDIQIEFGDISNVLAIVSLGDRKTDLERFISSLCEIKRRYQQCCKDMLNYEYIDPIVAMSPQKAFYAKKKRVALKDSIDCISGEFMMAYPPGIPIVSPGEIITSKIVDYVAYAKEKGCIMTGTQDEEMNFIQVVE